MSFSDTSSIWSPSCHRVPSTPPNPRADPTPPPFQGWQNSPVLKTKDCHEYHLRSHLRQPELVCCPKVDMLPTRLVQVWSDHQPEILNSTKSKIQSDVNEWPASRLKGWSWTREDQVFRLRQSAQPAPGRHIPWEPGCVEYHQKSCSLLCSPISHVEGEASSTAWAGRREGLCRIQGLHPWPSLQSFTQSCLVWLMF